ncbi:recombination protein RecR [Taibaiella sp. KBW10]|uniref:recombination mediator RecR n=1 Tax=Taibaiella sp. KBW10 TaxID=2153357 RepID=UPI000F59462D|nr:recombination mediator RecR [Taibaiella sp. KBW10]RQO30500.1 recombination protein RecR [Taibaiella sp. KBW10]
MIFTSKLIEDAVEAFCKLPGIGKKTALRMVLHLLKEQAEVTTMFTERIQRMREDIRFCRECNNIADAEICSICENPSRNRELICVVENFRDLITIENTGQFSGVYHILGGLLSPLEGIGPDQLYIGQLVERVHLHQPKELIMALSPTIEGDTTVYYISKLLKGVNVLISGIARGVAFGGELEYTDEITLGKAIAKRLPVDILQH